jgi:AcrR family transcriptional regulator
MTPGARRLVHAALAVLNRNGVAGLTLDAVAAEAGVSKGGLLYHFPSKQALLRGVVDVVTEDWQDDVRTREAADGQPGGRCARAYVGACADDRTGHEANFALLATLALDREHARLWSSLAAEWAASDRADGRVDPVDLTVARLAADGLWLATLFDLYGVRGEHRADVVERITALTREEPPA